MNQTAGIEPWRLHVLDLGSTAMAIAGAVAALWLLASAAWTGELAPVAWTTPLSLPVIACALWRRGPYFWRSLLFLTPPVAAVFALATTAGFTPTAALAGMTSLVIAGLLLGPRWAVGTWILTTLLMLSAGLLLRSGVIDFEFTPEIFDPSRLTNILRNTLAYALFSSLLALGTSVIVDRLSRSVAETRRALDAQHEIDAQWMSLVENAADQIVIVDRDHRIEFLNHSLSGLETTGFLGIRLEHLLPPDEAPRISEAIDRVFETGSPAVVTLAVPSGQGPILHLEARISPVLRNGLVHRVTIINANVTDRHHLEEQLRQSQKLEAVGELASGVAHDFNNLLTVISGFSEDLVGRVEPGSQIEQDLAKIQEAANRGARLTSQLLTFSRQHRTESTILDINSAIEGMREILQRLIGTPYRLELDLESAAGSVEADPVQIDQVLTNLVLNARDAMPTAGPIRIETRRVRIPDDRTDPLDLEPGDYVSFCVIDRGTGIAPELQDRIFEPFFTTKEVGKGTGLGLATSYGIIRSHQGAILVDSQPKIGTRFEVLLPSKNLPADAADPPAEIAASTKRPGRTILLVEDEPQIRALVGSALRRADYEVLEAEDGEAAVAVAEAHSGRIDLVLSDVRMPNMSGPELARTLRTQRPEIKVVFMTGFAAEIDTSGLDAMILSKPFSLRTLPGRLESVLGPHVPSETV